MNTRHQMAPTALWTRPRLHSRRRTHPASRGRNELFDRVASWQRGRTPCLATCPPTQ